METQEPVTAKVNRVRKKVLTACLCAAAAAGAVCFFAFGPVGRYAFAGLRLGYGLSADPDLLERLSRFAQPWSVSAPAQSAGMAAFTLCPSWPEQARTLVARERPLLAAELTDLGCAVAPSQANYLLFRVEKVTDLKERLIRKGVLIRACGNYQNLGPDWYRVCVRSGEENRRLLTALKEVL